MDEPRDGRSKKTTSKELLRPQAGPGVLLIGEKHKHPPLTHRMTGSAVLSHVKSFLPKLGAANSELMEKMREKGKESVEIEHVDESNPHIAMTLALLPMESPDSDSNSCSDADCSDDQNENSDDDDDNLRFEPVTLSSNTAVINSLYFNARTNNSREKVLVEELPDSIRQ